MHIKCYVAPLPGVVGSILLAAITGDNSGSIVQMGWDAYFESVNECESNYQILLNKANNSSIPYAEAISNTHLDSCPHYITLIDNNSIDINPES